MADYAFTLEPFSSEALAAYQAFPTVLDQSSEKIAWKLKDCPFGGGWALVARDADGVIVGMNAYQPVVMKNSAGEALRGHQSMDTVVLESVRGQGLFTRIYQAYYEQTDVDFVYGFPNRNSAPALFTKSGWTHFGTVPMRVKPFRTGFIARRLKLGSIDFSIPGVRRPVGSSFVFSSFDETHEAAWRSVLRQSPAMWGVDRSVDYLNWRYRDHPTRNYSLLGRMDGSFVVSAILDRHQARILYIMEALGEPDTLVDMLREVHADARGQGAELALVWGGNEPPLRDVFRRAGYQAFPDRLRPIELHFGARIFTSGPAPRRRAEWFLSYSDSDTV